MTDISPASEPVAPPADDAPAGDAPAVETPVVPTVGVVIPEDLDADLPENVDQFGRPYVESLRKQAANYRTKAKPYEDVFGEASETERDFLLGLNQKLLTDPSSATRDLVQLARQLAGDDFDSLLTDQTPEYLTPEAAQALWREQQEAAAAEQANKEAEAAVFSELAELGYEKDTPATANVLWRSMNQHGGDLKAAHAAIEAERQSIIDEYLKGKAADGASFVPVTSNAGVGGADPEGGPPKTLDDARNAAAARMEAIGM